MDHSHHSHSGHASPEANGLSKMAASATLHCLTGCAIGELTGLVLGAALGLSTWSTLALAVALAFLFGYTLSTLPLLRAGLGFFAALSVVLAADTLSILTMEIVDNSVMALVPGAMDGSLTNPVFWLTMGLALAVAYGAAYPVNLILLKRNKGHALTHEYHHGGSPVEGWRKLIPSFSTTALAGAIAAFLLGGLLVAMAAPEANEDPETSSHG